MVTWGSIPRLQELLALEERMGEVKRGATKEQLAALPVSIFTANSMLTEEDNTLDSLPLSSLTYFNCESPLLPYSKAYGWPSLLFLNTHHHIACLLCSLSLSLSLHFFILFFFSVAAKITHIHTTHTHHTQVFDLPNGVRRRRWVAHSALQSSLPQGVCVCLHLLCFFF